MASLTPRIRYRITFIPILASITPELVELRFRLPGVVGSGDWQNTRYVMRVDTSLHLLIVKQVRFASALSNYRTARKYNADFIFLIHDLWGADGTQNSTAPYPGDNGDWTSWDDYLTQVCLCLCSKNPSPRLYFPRTVTNSGLDSLFLYFSPRKHAR
jgi:hypothetical protein